MLRIGLIVVLALSSCAQTGRRLPPDQTHKYDGLYISQVERLSGTPTYCDAGRVSAKPWIVVNGEIRFRQNGRVGFNAPIAPDLTFSRALPSGSRLNGRIAGDEILAETDNPLESVDCHYRFKAVKAVSQFSETSPWDGSYKGVWTTVEDKNVQDFNRVMNGGCVSHEERMIVVRYGYVASNFSNSDIVAAPLQKDGTFEHEQGGWKFSGKVESTNLTATVTNLTCTVSIVATKS